MLYTLVFVSAYVSLTLQYWTEKNSLWVLIQKSIVNVYCHRRIEFELQYTYCVLWQDKRAIMKENSRKRKFDVSLKSEPEGWSTRGLVLTRPLTGAFRGWKKRGEGVTKSFDFFVRFSSNCQQYVYESVKSLVICRFCRLPHKIYVNYHSRRLLNRLPYIVGSDFRDIYLLFLWVKCCDTKPELMEITRYFLLFKMGNFNDVGCLLSVVEGRA